jgi:hypothetical protein
VKTQILKENDLSWYQFNFLDRDTISLFLDCVFNLLTDAVIQE